MTTSKAEYYVAATTAMRDLRRQIERLEEGLRAIEAVCQTVYPDGPPMHTSSCYLCHPERCYNPCVRYPLSAHEIAENGWGEFFSDVRAKREGGADDTQQATS